jgi:hypothetical protein
MRKVSAWTLGRMRLALSWCYPTLVVQFEEAVREDERRKQVRRCRPS